jgi:O-methyltransferase involved in polyketide biosynthesis
MDSTGISFTALFTGHVWYENGMSSRFFTSPKARLLYNAVQPVEMMSDRVLGLTVHDMLLQRHHIIDHRIDQLIKHQGVSQILEIACGYSPRGYKLSRKYPGLKYIEADLPHMAKRKQALLQQHNGFGPDHHVVACDVFESGAPHGLNYIMTEVLDPARPTIIVTEGLVNYFTLEHITSAWQTLAQLGKTFPKAWYITDLVPKPKQIWSPLMNAGTTMLSLATRANVNLHFSGKQQIEQGFLNCGFSTVHVHRPEDFAHSLDIPHGKTKSMVRVVEAQIH